MTLDQIFHWIRVDGLRKSLSTVSLSTVDFGTFAGLAADSSYNNRVKKASNQFGIRSKAMPI